MSTQLSSTNDQLELVAISDREWRVRDGSRPASDATSLLGFVAQVGEVFEVVHIGQPWVRRYFATFDDAVGDFIRNEIGRFDTAAA